METEFGMTSLLLKFLPAIITAIVGIIGGYALKAMEKKKDREFELAKIKSKIYIDIIIAARAAFSSDILDNKTQDELALGYNLWQKFLEKFDVLWLYGSRDSIDAFKNMMESYGKSDLPGYRKSLEVFINKAREDALTLYDQSYIEKLEYKFLTYNVDCSHFSKSFNRLSAFGDKK